MNLRQYELFSGTLIGITGGIGNDETGIMYITNENNNVVFNSINLSIDRNDQIVEKQRNLSSINKEQIKQIGHVYSVFENFKIENANYVTLIIGFDGTENNYKIYLKYDFNSTNGIKFKATDKKFKRAPLIFFDNEKSVHKLIAVEDNSENLYVFNIDNNYEIQNELKLLDECCLSEKHFSTLIDLSGNLEPNLVLDCYKEDQNKRFLNVCRFDFSNKEHPLTIYNEIDLIGNLNGYEVEEIKFLPNLTDGLLYNIYVLYSNKNGLNSILREYKNMKQISRDDLNYLDNIQADKLNLNSNINIKKISDDITLNGKFNKLYVSNLTSEFQGGDVFFLWNSYDGKEVKLILKRKISNSFNLEDVNLNQGHFKNFLNFINSDNKIIKEIAVGEFVPGENRQIIVNYVDNILDLKKVVIFETGKSTLYNRNNISVIYKDSGNSQNYALIPGASTIVGIKEGSKVKYMSLSQYESNTRNNFYPIASYYGVGSTNSFLYFILFKYNKSFKIVDIPVFPSTELVIVFKPEREKYVFEIYFESPYLFHVCFVVCVIAVFFMIVLAILMYYENKKKEIENPNTRLRRLIRMI